MEASEPCDISAAESGGSAVTARVKDHKHSHKHNCAFSYNLLKCFLVSTKAEQPGL